MALEAALRCSLTALMRSGSALIRSQAALDARPTLCLSSGFESRSLRLARVREPFLTFGTHLPGGFNLFRASCSSSQQSRRLLRIGPEGLEALRHGLTPSL